MKILVLTNLYPAPDLEKENTPIVHYFTREWVKMGYDVRVVNYAVNFPKLIMYGASLFKRQISSILGATIRTYQASEAEYELDKVKVKRIPVLKRKLHGAFSPSIIDKAYKKTINYLSEQKFKPDVIISHWVNPQLEIMDRLKRELGVKTCYIAHIPTLEFERIYKDEYSQSLINNIDLIGFRSAYIQKAFCEKFNYKRHSFNCYSGIPEQLIPEQPTIRDFKSISKFIFVGTLIKRKYPAEIIPAVAKSFNNDKFEISYIGKGAESKQINRYAKKFNVTSCIHELGYITREQVASQLRKADVFVMISRSEAFGLVYLEAMAQGCITIASKREGFDGIIKHGENGFLCEAGNVDELTHLITEIRNMEPEKLWQISHNAIETAKGLTDVKAAKLYIAEVEKLWNEQQDTNV